MASVMVRYLFIDTTTVSTLESDWVDAMVLEFLDASESVNTMMSESKESRLIDATVPERTSLTGKARSSGDRELNVYAFATTHRNLLVTFAFCSA